MLDKIELILKKFADEFTKNHRRMTVDLLNQQRRGIMADIDEKLAEVKGISELPELRRQIRFLTEEIKCREFDVNVQRMVVREQEKKIKHLVQKNKILNRVNQRYLEEEKKLNVRIRHLEEDLGVVRIELERLKKAKESKKGGERLDNEANSPEVEELKKKLVEIEFHLKTAREKRDEYKKLFHEKDNELTRLEIELSKMTDKSDKNNEEETEGIEVTSQLSRLIEDEIKTQINGK